MAGVHRREIHSLDLETRNSLVIGVIITSMRMKSFQAKRASFKGGERGVWTFTLRDSEHDFINVTIWGSAGYIQKLSSTFHIGDVVEVINGKVMERRIDDVNEKFVPSVSSPYSLSLNEGVSHMQIHDAPNSDRYKNLLALPTKSTDQLRKLDTILPHVEEMKDQYVDILVAVMFVSEARNVMTKDGKSLICCDVEVADGSCESTVLLRLWEDAWVERARSWEPRRTVLYLADILIAFNEFKKKTQMNIVRKTLITEDPNIPQASDVRQAIHLIPEYSTCDSSATPNPENITTVMTIRQISDRLTEIGPRNGDRVQFSTVVYAIVKEMNLDNSSDIITTNAICKRTVLDDRDSCMNLECQCGNGTRPPINVTAFNLRLNLEDHTGYLIGCKLTGSVAEQALGCDVTQFKAMTLEERGELKWKYLLERCDVRLQIVGPTSTFPRPLYNVLSIRKL